MKSLIAFLSLPIVVAPAARWPWWTWLLVALPRVAHDLDEAIRPGQPRQYPRRKTISRLFPSGST